MTAVLYMTQLFGNRWSHIRINMIFKGLHNVHTVMIERIYTLSYYFIKSEVWTIIYCLGLGHETIVCAICLSVFLSISFVIFTDTFTSVYVHISGPVQNSDFRALISNYTLHKCGFVTTYPFLRYVYLARGSYPNIAARSHRPVHF